MRSVSFRPVILSCLSIFEITVTTPSQLTRQGCSMITFTNTNVQFQTRNNLTIMSDHVHSLFNNASILSEVAHSKWHGNTRMQNFKITETWQRQYEIMRTNLLYFRQPFYKQKVCLYRRFKAVLAGPQLVYLTPLGDLISTKKSLRPTSVDSNSLCEVCLLNSSRGVILSAPSAYFALLQIQLTETALTSGAGYRRYG